MEQWKREMTDFRMKIDDFVEKTGDLGRIFGLKIINLSFLWLLRIFTFRKRKTVNFDENEY